MSRPCAAFLSYVRFEDEHEDGRLTQLRQRLSGEIRLQTGETFEIFQDRQDIAWGEQWRQRIEESLDAVTFLIPILTPGFFRSSACRSELERFLKREERLGRSDLILPVLYVNTPVLADEAKRRADSLAEVLAARQFLDWRELRFEPWTSPSVGRLVARMASQVVAALDRAPATPAREAGPSSAPTIPAPQRERAPETAKGRGAASSPTASTGFAPKMEPPTLVVDAFHRGDYSTLTEALRAAKPGSRLLVRPGIYKEGLVVDKPIEILGDGEPGDVVIEARGSHGILFRANMGRIANLTVRQAGGGDFYGIDVAQGRIEVESCDITSRSSACVGIHGGSEPRLRRNRIHDGQKCGVLVYESSQGILEDNEIFGNALSGVEIKEGSNPTLRRNRIHDGKSAGVVVYENGLGILEDNEILGNLFSGVEIKEGGNPTLRRNRIHDGKSAGVVVHKNGQGVLEDNEISGNVLAGIEIKEGANPTLRRNQVHDGSAGVYVHQDGQGVLEDNEIFGNAKAGIQISNGGNPTLRRNRIHDGKSSGVLVFENGLGFFEGNEIFSHPLQGLEIRTGGGPTLVGNRIHSNANFGIQIASGAEGVFEDNDLRGNAKGAWQVDASSEAKVRRARNLE